MFDLSEWQQSGKFFVFGKLPIFYRSSQAAEEVTLLLHGFPTASWDWHKIWDKLAEKFALLAYDYIGYGFSAKPIIFDYTTFNQVDITVALLDKLKIKKVHILSHDYGNTITQELLARIGEGKLNLEIASVFMLNGALFPETHRPILAQKILISPVGFLFAKLISDVRFKQSLGSIFGRNTQPTETEMDDFVRLFRHNGGNKIAHKLIRYMTERAKYRERWVSALQEAKMPRLMMNGLADRVSGAHLVKRLREVVPEFAIIELPDIGHYPQIEVPDKVLSAYFEFRQNL
jgi:pimeloyl-ACP methyl ester carboxylesterase